MWALLFARTRGVRRCPDARRPKQIVSEVHFRRHVCGYLRFGLSRVRVVFMWVLLFAHMRGVRRCPDARWPNKIVSEVHFRRHACGYLRFGLSRVRVVCV